MIAAADPVGPDIDRVLAAVTGTVVAGWGTNADSDRVTRAVALLPELHALGVTMDGHPRHPLYVRADAPLRVDTVTVTAWSSPSYSAPPRATV